MGRNLILVSTLLLALAAISSAQPLEIDSSRSTVTVYVYKTGLFSSLAHNHTIRAPITSGSIDSSRHSVVLSFSVSDMKLLDTEGSESEHREIESTMKGPKVLDSERFPTISFRSKQVDASSSDQYRVVGDLMLHGVTRELAVPVALLNGAYKGTVKLQQTDFGITPVKIAGGAVRVKDEIEIRFEIAPR